MPPSITLGMAKGFTLYMVKVIMSGPGKGRGHFGEDAEAGQHQNVDFGMVPRPEQIGIHHLNAVVHDLVKRQGWIGDDVRAGLQANCAPNITANTK